MRHLPALVLVLALILPACASDGAATGADRDRVPADAPTGSPSDEADAAGSSRPTISGEWVLTEGVVDGDALDASRLTLTITEGTASGHAGCNTYSATLTGDAPAIELGDLAVTRKQCDPVTMDIERAFLAALGRVDTAEPDAESLTLSGEGVRLSFTPSA